MCIKQCTLLTTCSYHQVDKPSLKVDYGWNIKFGKQKNILLHHRYETYWGIESEIVLTAPVFQST